ncbi:phenazine biosynthesis protein PhzD [Nonomuraea monospora]|uniref:Phenazine biosynthesis protein PhzD n=2 Tax=Nonomuraea monospora TaxID=568818 RepID=A0ABN3CSM0_9ACTN
MTIVAEFEPYPMPDTGELPGNTPPWTPDPRRAVLLLLDMRTSVLDAFPHGEAPLRDLLRNVAELREQCTRLRVPVAYAAQPGLMTERQQGLLKDFQEERGPRLDAAQRRFPDCVAPRPHDWLIAKRRHSAFHESTLLWRMRESGRDQLIVAGVYAHAGVLATAHDAFTHDIQPYIVADAIADRTAADHLQTLRFVAGSCGVTMTTKQLLFQLRTL